MNELQDSLNEKVRNYIRNFNVDEVLNEDPLQKTIFLKGKLLLDKVKTEENDKDCILILERPKFSIEDIKNILTSSNPEIILNNDIYNLMHLQGAVSLDAIKATMIYPATNKHLEKYKKQDVFMIEETYDDYMQITLPHITQNAFSLKWLYNILEKNSESETIVYEDAASPDTSFILLPDLKWDRKDVSQLYCSAIVHRRDLKSVRDLTARHIPLLENILYKSRAAIESTYKVSANKLRAYFHYQPSYFHLHVHFTHVNLETFGCSLGKAISLMDVIENLKMDGEYYRKKTLSFCVKENDALFRRYNERNGKVKGIE